MDTVDITQTYSILYVGKLNSQYFESSNNCNLLSLVDLIKEVRRLARMTSLTASCQAASRKNLADHGCFLSFSLFLFYSYIWVLMKII